jgi:hypothetical protein
VSPFVQPADLAKKYVSPLSSPLIYSADVLLPVVDLGYKDEWQPVVADRDGNPLIWGRLLRFFYWFEIAFGWVAGLLLVGVPGNLIKKD